MGETTSGRKERLSFAAIRTVLGLGGSFLAAAFVLEAYLARGFLIPAAIVTFVLVALTVRAFTGIRVRFFALATLAWLSVLFVLHVFLSSPA